METEPIYKTRWEKYTNINYQKCCSLEMDFRRTFHTCPSIMRRKRKLEKLVRSYIGSKSLTEHFNIDYKNRKESFYRKIIYDILKDEENEREKEICEITKDILFIYSKKKEELEYIDYLSNHLEAEESHREEMRESMIEYWRDMNY
jgi:hypothetical protein